LDGVQDTERLVVVVLGPMPDDRVVPAADPAGSFQPAV
jgi:hypothetical protein